MCRQSGGAARRFPDWLQRVREVDSAPFRPALRCGFPAVATPLPADALRRDPHGDCVVPHGAAATAAPAIPAAKDCPPGVSASWHGLSPLGCRRGPRFQSGPTCRQRSGTPETAFAPASRAPGRNRLPAWARNPSPCTTSPRTISRAKSRLGNRALRLNLPRFHQLIHRKPPPRTQSSRRHLCLSVSSENGRDGHRCCRGSCPAFPRP